MAGIAQNEYDAWLADPTPDTMAGVVKALDPVLVTEVQHYSGPKPLLRAKAKSLAVKAVKSYDPAQGAQLRSWVTTQLKPLSRYSQRMRSVQVSEMASRQAAELHTMGQRLAEDLGREPTDDELADSTGLSLRRIEYLKSNVKPSLTESQLTKPTSEGEEGALPAVTTSNVAQLSADAVYQGLGPREKAIFDWKTGAHGKQQLSNQDIARRLGVTPALVSQISERISKQIQDVSHAI